MQATYSPEDNKLRLYPSTRLDADTYARVRAAGFIWAPKQELFVAPMWTASREDLLIELCGEVGDEDTSLVDRAEARAERFDNYSEKRAADADQAHKAVSAITDGIPFGQPILIGHHSERHARRDAEKIENGMRKAVKMWETSQYWTARAAGAVAAAKYKELPAVRARRIKGLEADRRKMAKDLEQLAARLKFFSKDGLTSDEIKQFCGYYDAGKVKLADGSDCWSAWSALEDGKITTEEVRAQKLISLPKSVALCERWVAHIDNRLTYERAMLAADGGTAADKTKPEKGGAVLCWVSRGWLEIVKVNKVTVSVKDNWGNGGRDFLRNVPFDKLKAVVGKAEWDAIKAQGGVAPESTTLKTQPVAEKADDKAADFKAMKTALKTGVRVVTAPQLFPTPPELAARMVELAEIEAGQRILEPSAGTGRILAALPAEVDAVAVEVKPSLAEVLKVRFPEVRVLGADFLTTNGDLGKFDRVLMNPPFENAADIKHILHAMRALKPGGRLVAICANGPRQQEALKPLATSWEDLAPGTFKEAGTQVNTALLVIEA